MSLIKSSSLFLVKSISRSSISERLFCNETSKSFYDIIIAGGGMVGTTLACALGMKFKLRDKKILLLEGSKANNWQLTEKYSNRVVALNPATQKLLESIGAWGHIERARYGSVKKMQVWDALSEAMITFDNDNLIEHVAYIVENDLLLSAVDKIVKEMPNVTVVHEAKIKDYNLPNITGNRAEVILNNDQKYHCSLLLGADGANSKVRQKMGVQYLKWDYNQLGVVATLNLSEAGDNIVAWQRLVPSGSIALLPLNDTQSSLVWSTATSHAKDMLKMPEDQFVDELNQALWKVYSKDSIISTATKSLNNLLQNLNLPSNAVRQLPPNVKSIEPNSRAGFPLGFGHATNYIANGVALVGDAAHRVHPLAGQGVNLGFGDAICIADLLADSDYSGRNLGSILPLKKYETLRQRHNIPTMLAIDGLQKLYCTDLAPIVLLRTLGLQITHALNPVKKLIMSHAMA